MCGMFFTYKEDAVKKVMIVFLIVLILGGAGVFAYHYFIDMRTLDKGGMENPNFKDDSGEGIMDGDYTYVDNEALLNMIAGVWGSDEGSYTLNLDNDYHMILALDGENVLDAQISFTYLQPGKPRTTEIDLSSCYLKHQDGTIFGSVESFCYALSDDDYKLFMEISYDVWKCGCGETAVGEYCPKCGRERPVEGEGQETEDGNGGREIIGFKK